MIKKLRRKFVLIMMSIVTLILLALFVSVLHSTRSNLEHAHMAAMRQALHPADMLRKEQGGRPGMHQERPPGMRVPIMLVEVAEDREIQVVQNQIHFIEQSMVEEIAQSALGQKGETGTLRAYNLRYLKESGDAGLKIAFVDMSMETNVVQELIINSLLVGAGALLLFFFVSIWLARWAVRPVQQAWEQQRQFVADASHELKTPLTVILSNADMLAAKSSQMEEKDSRRLDNIRVEGARMKALVEDLLLLARSDSMEKSTVVFSVVDFSDVTASSVLIFEPSFFDNGQRLEQDIQEGIAVMGDSQHLRQVVDILLDNARKYCPNGKEARISLRESGRKYALLTVSNQGDPIPENELEAVFRRFYRRDKVRTGHSGVGLGLSIAQNIVDAHNGKIWAESSAALGNSFCVQLPLAQEK